MSEPLIWSVERMVRTFKSAQRKYPSRIEFGSEIVKTLRHELYGAPDIYHAPQERVYGIPFVVNHAAGPHSINLIP